jgi:hypothetical protein
MIGQIGTRKNRSALTSDRGLTGIETDGLGSPEGKAAGADVAKFATEGADTIMFDTREV